METDLQVGAVHPPEQAEVLDHPQILRPVQQVPGATDGCSATAQAAPTCRSSPGPGSSGTAMVKSGASPDDPALADYWAERRRKTPPPTIDKANLRLFEAQHGRCSYLRGLAPARRRAAAEPARVGAMAARRPHDDHPDRRAGARHHGRTEPRLITRPLPRRAPPPVAQRPSTSVRPRASGACLSRVR